ncbi:MAG TPA: Yip1 family protein [Mobilitalea sp.]|nr:Yip1 family protein [Mobilitalea sp.]
MSEFYKSMNKYVYPLYILVHPVDGFQELKNNKKYSLKVANIILAVWVLLKILDWGYVDFDFTSDRHLGEPVQLQQILLTSIVIFTMAAVSNWCFTTLMDGKGKFVEIWITCAYALLPYEMLGITRVILTYFLVRKEEGIFLDYMNTVGVIWSMLLIFLALHVIHDYTAAKTIASIALTIIGVLIMLFLVVLVSGLASQVYSFVVTIFFEIRLRML